MAAKKSPLFDPTIVKSAIAISFTKLNPEHIWKNPVMFVTEVGAAVTTAYLFTAGRDFSFVLQIAIWLWFTVLFANFAEAMAEGRGKAQADTLRKSRTKTTARKLLQRGGDQEQAVAAETLRRGDHFVCEANDTIPADGEIVEGAATVNESAITGESAPVIREAGGDRSAVTGGTTVLSDRIVVMVTANPGESFMDRMIGLIEGAKRQKTPNENA
ncbi:MAG: K+-transporting ATPase subunit [Phycisphaerales bacterium]|nr:K+-transporting ATPase subunit [Phycisphaerales bacterium]